MYNIPMSVLWSCSHWIRAGSLLHFISFCMGKNILAMLIQAAHHMTKLDPFSQAAVQPAFKQIDPPAIKRSNGKSPCLDNFPITTSIYRGFSSHSWWHPPVFGWNKHYRRYEILALSTVRVLQKPKGTPRIKWPWNTGSGTGCPVATDRTYPLVMTNIAMENGHRMVSCPNQNGDFPSLCVKSPEGIPKWWIQEMWWSRTGIAYPIFEVSLMVPWNVHRLTS